MITARPKAGAASVAGPAKQWVLAGAEPNCIKKAAGDLDTQRFI